MTRVLAFIIVLLGVAMALDAQPTTNPSSLPETVYLFSSFRGNGEDGLHLAYSTDGLKWTALNGDRSFLKPAVGGDKLMRDPCIMQGPDGKFHMIWTTSWHERNIGYANSSDLIHWSEQKAIPVMEHEPTARNCWAPELVYDAEKQQYLTFWATTIPGRFAATDAAGDNGLNHRMYCTTTKDFESFTPTRLFYDPGFSVIDATMIKDGGRYYLIVKDETRQPAKKHLRIASGASAEGPFENLSPPFTPDWVEGPSALKVGDWWIVYFDMYTKHRYGAMRSKDLKTWEDITGQLSFPRDMRHGTALKVSREVGVALMKVRA